MSDKPFKLCPTCGTPQIDETLSLVLYFKSEKDRAEFAEVVKEFMPNASTFSTEDNPELKNA